MDATLNSRVAPSAAELEIVLTMNPASTNSHARTFLACLVLNPWFHSSTEVPWSERNEPTRIYPGFQKTLKRDSQKKKRLATVCRTPPVVGISRHLATPVLSLAWLNLIFLFVSVLRSKKPCVLYVYYLSSESARANDGVAREISIST